MSKSITAQIENLQKENERLHGYEKLFEKALKNEFGLSRKDIKKQLNETSIKTSDFERKICSFFDLESEDDKNTFLTIMCSDSSLRFFTSKKTAMKSDN